MQSKMRRTFTNGPHCLGLIHVRAWAFAFVQDAAKKERKRGVDMHDANLSYTYPSCSPFFAGANQVHAYYTYFTQSSPMNTFKELCLKTRITRAIFGGSRRLLR